MLFELKALHEFHLYWRQKMDEDVLGKSEDLTVSCEATIIDARGAMALGADRYPLYLN